jgi:hypothetical protein
MLHLIVLWLYAGILSLIVTVPMNPAPPVLGQQTPIYWGAWISGETYGYEDAPWDERTLAKFEEHAGKPVSILHWGQAWWRCHSTCGYQEFYRQRPLFDRVRQRGIIPMVDWAAWDADVRPQFDQPDFSLQAIIDGKHDKYIRRWAKEARRWGHPFFLRFNWEMNGDWFPWSEEANGNSSGQYVAAWRHVHELFGEERVKNVTWVWCPNVIDAGDTVPLEHFYPGDDYVDWMCMDGYNWGQNPAKPDDWKSFTAIFAHTYAELLEIDPDKPIMIGEISSTEVGGSKADWITEMLEVELPEAFPGVKALVWFNWNTDGMDWVIESSSSSQEAFAKSISSAYYSSEQFAELSASPIPPLELPTPACAADQCELGENSSTD